MGSFYVTTPIYYVNDLPHIGHIYTTIVADVVARYHRMIGDRVHFLTGTDEHGQNIQRAAAREGVTPLELADRVVERYHRLWPQLRISHDDFIRTTETRHRRGVEKMIGRLQSAGDLYVAPHEGWYCPSCETFYTEKELLPERLCPLHERPVEREREENVFFRLSRYQQPLLDWIEEQPESIQPESRRNEVRSFVAGGLRDLSVSRASLSWGIPFPGHPGQTVYVWLDALTNYLSALGFGGKEDGPYQELWAGEGTRLHLLGKDILRHHCVYWPAFLMAAELPLPTTVWAHGWWLRDEKKVSKSTGNLVRPDHLIDRFGADPLRYYLMREMVFGQDAAFSDEAFVERYNSDLANDLGNTVSRLVVLSRNTFDGRTPPETCGNNPLIEAAERTLEEYRQSMEELAFQQALEALWRLLAEANQYLVAREPWHLVKSDGASGRVSRILWNGLEAVRHVAIGLHPFMPGVAPQVLAAIGAPEAKRLADATWGGEPTGIELPEPEALFPRIDQQEYLGGLEAMDARAEQQLEEEEEEKTMIDIQEFGKVELKIGRVTAAEEVQDADRLLRLEVDVGEDEPRQLVAGIAEHYETEALVGRQVVVVTNLETATIRGVESQGMALAATVEGRPVLLRPDAEVPVGSPVR